MTCIIATGKTLFSSVFTEMVFDTIKLNWRISLDTLSEPTNQTEW